MSEQVWQRDTVGAITAPPEVLAREALTLVAEKLAPTLGANTTDLMSPFPPRNVESMEARWIYLWCLRIVAGAQDWQVVALLGHSLERMASYHRALQLRANQDAEFQYRLDRHTRRLAADVAWKRPIRTAVRAHFHAADRRRA